MKIHDQVEFVHSLEIGEFRIVSRSVDTGVEPDRIRIAVFWRRRSHGRVKSMSVQRKSTPLSEIVSSSLSLLSPGPSAS